MPVPADQDQFLFWAHKDNSKGNTHESWILAEGPIQRGTLDITFKITFPGWIIRVHDSFPLENFPGRHQ